MASGRVPKTIKTFIMDCFAPVDQNCGGLNLNMNGSALVISPCYCLISGRANHHARGRDQFLLR